MPDRAMPTYRYRGAIQPSAEVSRPAAAYRNATSDANGSATPSTATLDIFDVIDSYGGWWGISAAEVDYALKRLGDVDTLYVRLNSPGGEATEGVAIANLLRAHQADVRVTVYGLAASAASVIAIAGDTVSMAPGSMLMIHDAWDIEIGAADDFRRAADALDAVSDSYAGLYAAKAGGTADKWRAVMREDKWLTADAAVSNKLADRVGLDPELPAGLPPVEDDEPDIEIEIEIDVELNPAALAAARRFDLSILPNAPAALAPQAPAASADGSTETQEGSATVEFTDEQLTTMRQQLGLPEDADAAAIIAAQAEALAEQADPPAADPAPAATVPEGSVVVSESVLEELRIAARAGQEARAVQLRQDRDETINAAIRSGHIAPARRDHWTAQWDADAEGARAAIATLTAGDPLFPVGPTQGVQGHDGGTGSAAVFSDDEAEALAQLAGTTKEALLS